MQEQTQQSLELLTDKLQGWVDLIVQNLPNIALAIMVLVTAFLTARLVSKWVKRLIGKRVPQKSISNLIANMTSVFVVLLGLFLALSIMNLSNAVMSLLTGAGVAGLVIGLALQGTLSNTVSGIVLSFRKNVSLGDWVETNGYAGEVIQINLNNFIIREADNNTVIIPNKTIIENPLKNYSLTTKMRVTLHCGVGYESDLDLVEQLTKQTISDTLVQVDSTDEVEFYFQEFGDSAINYMTRFYIEGESALEKFKAKNTIIKAIKKAYDRHGINIPFPIRTLQFNNKLKINSVPQEAFSTN